MPRTALRLPALILLAALLSACAPQVSTPTAPPSAGATHAPQSSVAPHPSPQPPLLARLPAAQAGAFRAGYAALASADPAEAERAFEGLARASLPGEAAAEARLRLGEAQARAGHPEVALATLDEVQRRFPGTPQADQAPYFVGLALQAAGRADEARERLASYASGHPQVAAAIWLRVAEDDLERGQHAQAAEAARRGLASAQARGLRAALLERLGEAESALGQAQAAFDAYRQTLALAQGKSELGEQLFHLAQAYQGIGKREEAARALQAAVEDFPAARTTADALRLLGELKGLGDLDRFELGLARYYATDFYGAAKDFDIYLSQRPTGPDADRARLYRALAQMGFGPDPEAIDQLQRLAERAEDPEIAAQALLEAGKALEQLFRSRDAQASYEDALRRFGSADVAPQIAFRLGFARYLDKDYQGAARAWTDLLRGEPEPEARAQALFWQGKALVAQGRKDEAQARWREAAKLEPGTLYGARAEAALTPTLSQGERGQGSLSQGEGGNSLSPWERAGVRAAAPTRAETQGRGPVQSLLERVGVKVAPDQNAPEAELKRWFSERRLDLDQAAAEAAADPDYQQAQALAALSLYREGNWQAEALLTRHAERGDRLYWLARRFHELSLFAGGLQLGQAALEASGARIPAQAPTALREAAYPLAYGSALSAAAAGHRVDSLFLAALVREESGFDPWTDALGQARGLARLRPVRVEEAAAATGLALDPARLFEPRTNLELAAWLLADRLRRYEGRLEPTLVAYTTSEGAADVWLAFKGTADPDVFLEQVPFDASRNYALGVLSSYQVYRGLYEQGQPASPAAAAPYDLGRAGEDIVRLRQGVSPPALLAPAPAAEAPADLRLSLGRGLELKAAGRCAEAKPLLLQAGSSDLGAYAHLELAACAAGLGQHREALDHLARAQEQPGPSLLRLEARERSAEALLGLGQTEDALGVYRQLLAETRYAPYRAQLRHNLAAIERALGHRDAAIEHLRTALAEDPEGLAGQAALGQLETLGARDAAPLSAGLIRFHEKRYREAIAYFDAALAARPSGAAMATARYHRAVAVLRLGQERQGIDDLRQLARDLPGSAEAPQALFKAGRVLESLKEYRQAAGVYQELAEAYPGSTYAPDARFRAGLAAYQQGTLRAAAEDWRTLVASGPDPEVAAQAQFWLGKALQGQGDRMGARTTWERLVARSPDSYYGLRAADLLAGRTRPELGPASRQPEALAFSEADRAAVVRWAAGQGATPAQLEAEAGFRRARSLLGLGLRAQARWELEALASQWSNSGGRLALLAAQLNTWGVYDLSLKSALRASWSAPGAPRALQKLIYPVPYPELVAAQATSQGADPLLFSALMRQESLFDQFARSPSHARGLTQIIAPTGYDIAQRLKRSNFQVADLFRPEVSIEFGAWYVARRLEHYRGMPMPAIAAYNGGDWAVDSWLLAYGDEDPDTFVEGIPFSETQPYVQHIYEFWQAYRGLYE